MTLSDLTVRQAKAAEKAYSIPDTDGLGLVVTPTGGQIVAPALLLARQAKAHLFGQLSRDRTTRSTHLA